MRRELINNSHGNRCAIAFFAGWGMDEAPFKSLNKRGYDIYLFYDYRTVEPELYEDLFRIYDSVAVVAWSFGVAVANCLLTGREETRIAVNGTAQGVDNRYGLPKPYNNLTLRTLSDETLNAFYHRIYPDELYDLLFSNKPQRDLSELAEELKVFGDTHFPAPSPLWDKVYVSAEDLIIPPSNQLRSWTDHNPVVIEKGAHGVDFQRIIDADIVNKTIVAQKFTRKAQTYETHAAVQRNMAVRLMEMLHENGILFEDKDILEVGIGTGFLTRLYAREPVATMTAVDIADTAALLKILRQTGCDYDGTVITADAEAFVADKEQCYDMILSASTIQWFNSQRQFIANSAKALCSGGILAFATFAPGTFQEISSITQKSLTYHDPEWYKTVADGAFELVDCREETEVMSFPDSRKLLEHISLTGVNGITQQATVGHTITLMKQLPPAPTLTYKPIYLVFRKL